MMIPLTMLLVFVVQSAYGAGSTKKLLTLSLNSAPKSDQATQQKTGGKVVGVIVDEEGEPMIGVTIRIKGTGKGTVTNFDGEFTIEVDNRKSPLVFSYIGKEDIERAPVIGQKMKLVMKDSQLGKKLDEVVVVGYGTMKKRDFVAGSSVWNLADFYSEVRGDAVPHVNSKGILGLDRGEKDAYLYYKAMLSEKPSLYIGGKDWKYRTHVSDAAEAKMDVPVFARAAQVTVTCNQKLLGTFSTVDGVAMVSVPFQDGENRVEATAVVDGQKVSDAITVMMRIIPQSFAKGFPASGLHITCGDPRYMEDKEEALCWMPEKAYEEGSWGYVGGSVYRRNGELLGTDADILGTEKDPIYQTQRQDIEAFKADVPDGEYIVTLHFASMKEGAALVYNLSAQGGDKKVESTSVFDVTVNGEKALDSFDPSYCGISRAIAKRINVLVKNGNGLDIRFQALKGKTVLNAIEIYKR